MANGTSDKELLIMAWAKAVIAVVLVGVVGYAFVTGIAVDGRLLEVVLLFLASYFGLSAKMYHASSRGGRGGRKGG